MLGSRASRHEQKTLQVSRQLSERLSSQSPRPHNHSLELPATGLNVASIPHSQIHPATVSGRRLASNQDCRARSCDNGQDCGDDQPGPIDGGGQPGAADDDVSQLETSDDNDNDNHQSDPPSLTPTLDVCEYAKAEALTQRPILRRSTEGKLCWPKNSRGYETCGLQTEARVAMNECDVLDSGLAVQKDQSQGCCLLKVNSVNIVCADPN